MFYCFLFNAAIIHVRMVTRAANGERSPLLQGHDHERGDHHDRKVASPPPLQARLTRRQLIELSKEDGSDPRAWSKRKKLGNIAVIASMSGRHYSAQLID